MAGATKNRLVHPRRPPPEANVETMQHTTTSTRYAKCVEASKRIRWDIDRDVIRGRTFEVSKEFVPDGLSKADSLEFLSGGERRLVSQIQGRTYANILRPGGTLYRGQGARDQS